MALFLQQGSLLYALTQLSATQCVPTLVARDYPLIPPVRRVVVFSHFSLVWAKTLSNASLVSITSCIILLYHLTNDRAHKSVRFVPIALGLIISFVSDTSYTINDVREMLPGYLALLLHILSTGAFEHFRSLLVHNIGSKYISVCCTVGAAAVSLIAYTSREILVGRPRLLICAELV